MSESNIIIQENGHVLTITINRPNQLNALNRATISELHEAIKSANQDENIGVVILTGSGEKAFVAGADIKEFANFKPSEGQEVAASGQEILFNYNCSRDL